MKNPNIVRSMAAGLGVLAAICLSSPAGELDFELVLAPGQASHEGNSVALDSKRNIYLTGQLAANRLVEGQLVADIAGTNLVVQPAQEYFLIKYDPSGTPIWVRTAGGSLADYGTCVRIAPNDEPVVVLAFAGTNFHGASVASYGKQDFALARYSRDGDLLWVQTAGGPERDGALDLDFDTKGDIYVVGRLYGQAMIGTQPIGQRFQDTGFIAKYTASGQFVWAKDVGNIAGDIGIDIDAEDNLWLTGDSNGRVANLTGTGVFVARYDTAGNPLWARLFPSRGGGTGILAVKDGLLVAGTHTEDLTLGNTTLSTVDRQLRGFVARFTLGGEPVWAQQVGGRAYAVAAGPDGAVYAGGFYSANAPKVAGQTPPLAGNNEAYLAKFSADGQFEALNAWAAASSGDIVRDVVLGPDGHLYLTGEIHGSALQVDPWAGRAFLGRIRLGEGPPTPGPQISLHRAGNDLILSWPADAAGFRIETAPSLGQPFAPAAFEAVEGQPNQFRVPLNDPSRFIRLTQ